MHGDLGPHTVAVVAFGLPDSNRCLSLLAAFGHHAVVVVVVDVVVVVVVSEPILTALSLSVC